MSTFLGGSLWLTALAVLVCLVCLIISRKSWKKRAEGYRRERNEVAQALINVIETMEPGPHTFEVVTLTNATYPFNVTVPRSTP